MEEYRNKGLVFGVRGVLLFCVGNSLLRENAYKIPFLRPEVSNENNVDSYRNNGNTDGSSIFQIDSKINLRDSLYLNNLLLKQSIKLEIIQNGKRSPLR
jgi:hypothetical protein